ncbi:hypothetical protein CMO86_09460 [Candidatus Woesearchaeota archaeon]|nr:hypothetical protein [Candidatus Woesearchaeota archaeon]|tara:strand:+ start:6628 stop:7242 length:615 start_codon:yes stop_codon:yes gene_type:complete
MTTTEVSCEYKDFVGTYRNVYPDDFCEHMINAFEHIESGTNCVLKNRQQEEEGCTKTEKDDNFVFLDLNILTFPAWRDKNPIHMVWKGLQVCFDQYVNQYDHLLGSNISGHALKMQRTDPGQGYHIWHHENDGYEDRHRCLAFSIYLNDIEDAGETEFLYLKRRVKPERNKCVIWPAGFTHVHRGNVVHGTKSKYIITGWFYYI